MEASGQLHAPETLHLGKESQLGGPQRQPEGGGEERKSLPLLGIKPLSPSLWSSRSTD